jgi:crotonobetainyl-CoA:carnitine CoA-transferase CaiB-like acyl-CoA transferase
VLDLKTQGGKEVLHKLLAQSDVLVQNFRPKVMQRLGLDYETIRESYPDLIYVSISGFGENGPLADRPSFDHIMQCHVGFVAAQAGPKRDGEPALIRNVLIDKVTAMTAAQATTAALFARSQGAGGQEIKLSMLGVAVAFLWPDAAGPHHLLGDDVEIRPSLADRARLFPFRNGWGTFNGSDASFAGLCRDLNAPTGNDPRLKTAAGRARHKELMLQVEREWAEATAQMDVDEGLAIIEANGAPCAKVRDLDALIDDEQVVANGYLRIFDHPVAGQIREPRPAAEFSAMPLELPAPAPTLGQQTHEILAELGFDADARNHLQQQGALGPDTNA